MTPPPPSFPHIQSPRGANESGMTISAGGGMWGKGVQGVISQCHFTVAHPRGVLSRPANGGIVCLVSYLFGTSISCQHGAFSQFFRLFSTFGLMHQNVVTLGGGMCMLFEICEKTPFQKCMGLGGGGRWSQFCTQSWKREDTQGTGNAPRITHYSESDSLSSLPLSTRAGTPLGHTSPCL